MRCAIVISLLVHLLLFAALLEPPALPRGAPRNADGSMPLSVSFRSTGKMGNRVAESRSAAMPTPMLAARDLPVRMIAPVSPAKLRGDKKRNEDEMLLHVDAAENLASLPADMEREYRINLARAARLFQYYPAAVIAKGQQGIVRMSISYWSRSGVPRVTLEQSSGYGELDQEALKTVALAIGKAPLPAGAQDINFRIPYALEYGSAD